jgi:hypothetical protein
MGTGGKKPLMRALGEFVGHIAKGITTDPSKPAATRQTVRERVEEETRETPEGKVILRRTTIEEIEVRRDEGGPAARGG